MVVDGLNEALVSFILIISSFFLNEFDPKRVDQSDQEAASVAGPEPSRPDQHAVERFGGGRSGLVGTGRADKSRPR